MSELIGLYGEDFETKTLFRKIPNLDSSVGALKDYT